MGPTIGIRPNIPHRSLALILVVVVVGVGWPVVSAARAATPAGQVTEFAAGIVRGSVPYGITAGPDGNTWFTEAEGNRIGRITPSGVVTEFAAGITASSEPRGITAGPDGNVWFTEYYGDRIGRITPQGVVSEFAAGITAVSRPRGITAGPDGNMWFTEYSGNRIGRITPSGVVSEFAVGITAAAEPQGITAGPDGNMWFTEYGGNRIGRITPQGVVSEFAAGITAGSYLRGITAGPDGNVWFTEYGGDRIGRITTGATRALTTTKAGTGTGTVTSLPAGIACGATCVAEVDYLAPVTLTATAAAGSRFAGWSGEACSGTGTCAVAMDAARSVIATFALDVPAVSVDPPVVRVARTSLGFSSKVTVNRAGTIAQRFTSGSRAVRTWCRTSRTFAAAGTYTLTCNLGKAGRRYIRTMALKGAVRTTFTVTGEPAVQSNRTVTIRRRR